MIEELENKISTIKEVLSTRALNNSKNIASYINEIEKIEQDVKNNIDQVIELLRSSNSKYDEIIPNPNIDILKKEIEELERKFILLNNFNSSFEKMGLDVITYDISKYYKGNLEQVNEDIKASLDKFKEAGITLTIKDFNYSHFVREYMDAFLNNKDNLESIFEQIYWKCPNIITHIELNIKYLYFKKKKAFDKYISLQSKKILNQKTKEELIEEYKTKRDTYTKLLMKDTFLNFNKFKNKELKVSDYSRDKVEKVYLQFTEIDKEELYNDDFFKLYNNLKEYKSYLQYKFVYDDIMKIYAEKDKYKNASKAKLKEITKEEKKLMRFNKKYERTKNLDKKTKLDLDINNSIRILSNLYSELNDVTFNEKICINLSANSTIETLFNIASSYFAYLVKCIKSNFEEIEQDSIDSKIKELNSFLLNPYNTMINNLNISEEYNIPMIISDKYKLASINLPIEILDEANMDNLLSQLELIINYYIFNHMLISIEEIDLYCKAQELLDNYKNID